MIAFTLNGDGIHKLFKGKSMTVAAKINKLPVLVTDADVNELEEEDEADWEVEFEVNEFELCCGVIEVGHAKVRDLNFARQSQNHMSAEHKVAFVEALKNLPYEYDTKGLAIYTLTDNQTVEAEALVEAGFEVMAIFKNPNSGNRITMCGLLMNQPRAKPVPAKKAKKKKPVRR